jgi:RND family efflux transporter MFP subunit
MNNKGPTRSAPRVVKLSYVLTPIAIILVALVIVIFLGALAPKPSKSDIVIKAPLVEVISLKSQQVTFTIKSQGNVTPRTLTSLTSEVAGQVISVSDKFKVGGFFQKGEILLTIDDINYEVAVIQAQSRLGVAQANLIEEQARAQQAKEEWLLSNKTLDLAPVMALRKPQLQKAQAEINAAKGDLKHAETKLVRTKILAPYDAMIKEKQVDIGQYVSTGSMLATTFAVDYAEARLPVRQRDLLFLDLPKINQTAKQSAKANLSSSIGRQTFHWPSVITRYEGVVDSASRVHYVIAQIDDPYAILSNQVKQALPIGSFVNAEITGKTVDHVVAIPRRAVYGANTLHMADADNKLRIQSINILHSDQDYVYSKDIIDASHRLVITPLETPVIGMKLRINEQLSAVTETPLDTSDNGKPSDIEQEL